MSLLKYFYNFEDSALTAITKDQYENDLVNIDDEKAKRAFERACSIRDFEIEMYWKRATYFWAFIASAFAGYLALISSDKYSQPDKFNHVEVYFLICIGFVLSVAWILINKGSKSWQRNWEAHVDLLENKFTGPLYKTVYPTKTFSVSKINEIISFVFAIIWFLLGVKYFTEQNLLNFRSGETNWFAVLSTLTVVLAIMAMIFGYGRGRFTDRRLRMYRRRITYE